MKTNHNLQMNSKKLTNPKMKRK